MKKVIFTTISIIFFTLFMSGAVFAQGMTGNNMMGGNNTITQSDDGHTAREEVEGEAIWEKFQTKELKCEDLSDDDFGALGEYFMGQMAGEQHEEMNNIMIQMMGEEGEKQMHVAMGKRMSGCEPNAPMPESISGGDMMSMMMNMMMGGGGNGMMGNFGAGPLSWFNTWGIIVMILFWLLAILGAIALIKWLLNQGKGEVRAKSALDILKERYAKGEIPKKRVWSKKE